MPAKLTYDEIKRAVRKKGFSLLSTPEECLESTATLRVAFYCKRHGRQLAPFGRFRYGYYGCNVCAEEERKKNLGLSRRKKYNRKEKILGLLRDKNLVLVSQLDDYPGSGTIFTIKCQKHNYEFDTCYYRLQALKVGCLYCLGAKPQITVKTFLEEIKKLGYTCYTKLPDKINLNTAVKLSCGEHPKYDTWIRNILSGHRCPYCKGVKLVPLTVSAFLKHMGFELLSEYKDVDSKLKLRCEKGHIWFSSLRSLKHDSGWCTLCKVPFKSAIEFKIIRLIKKWMPNSEVYHNDRKILKNGKELDIVIENKKIAIEPGGLHFHNELYKPNDYHYKKYLRAKKKGYRLLTIWDYEWKQHKIAVIGRIKAILGCNKIQVGARKTQLKIASANDPITRKFLNTYHVQGTANFKYCYQLWYENKLVSVMTFNPHHRQNCKELVLNRYCVKKDFTIHGGAKKLFKTARESLKTSIVSYSDNRWSDGNIYELLGFKHVIYLKPDYFYTNKSGSIVRSKQSLKKTSEEKLLNKTEHELRLAQGLFRVYDCGKQKWIFNYKKEGDI